MTSHARLLRTLGAIVLATLALPTAARSEPLPVLLVIANRDFWYEEYADVRQALSKRGLPVVVAAGNATDAVPQASGSGKFVRPELTLSEASAGDYSAVVFVGGWGASQYQYAFSGTYASAVYRADSSTAQAANQLISEFIAQDKPVAALSHGVTALAWARVDGVSPLKGRMVTAWPGGGPAFTYDGQSYGKAVIPVDWHVIQNGGLPLTSASVGDPLSRTDDVWVDGKIITAENYESAALFARTLALVISGR